MVSKAIKTILPRTSSHWVGDGFKVYPVFANMAFTKEISPFLMLDYAAPKEFSPSLRRRGVGKHPHRGFETVTIAFQGEVEHGDSLGHRDVIKEGDVQWMTAAGGIIHEEFHSTEFAKQGGRFEMIQLWVNLPKAHKMDPPRYQPILAKDIPTQLLSSKDKADGGVRIIAGNYDGVKGPAKTFSPVNLWDVQINTPEKLFEFDFEAGHNAMIFVRKGAVVIGEDDTKELGPQDMAVLETQGTRITIKTTEVDTKLMLLSGEPINEPIAARGPFVMNTHQEIIQANEDYHNGNFVRS
uniref:Pirin N-terminal domain-containing protein n=1 Tax=Aplanochytrium stocchinoi TaxID=215587 RepID=A0A7S3LPR6_9STRA|mmetsp:Transcript_15120/g.18697  ORF Transcript_15120/g.18697 Transcript_15120/m.18697 type:complete len:296 (+) Transcript_15120:311-1198(+)